MFWKMRITTGIVMLIMALTVMAETLFQIKDELGSPVLVVSSDGLAILNSGDTLMVISTEGIKAFIEEDPAKGLSRSFSVTTTSSVKGANDKVMNVTADGLRIYDQTDESKLLGDTLMTISSKSIKAHIGGIGKALSRSFSVSTTSSTKDGQTKVMEVGTESTRMKEASGDEYSDFSPDNIFIGLNAGNSITEGLYNVFIGNSAGFNTLGGLHLQNPDTGYRNIFIGHESGFSNEWGKNNIFLGYKSGYSNLAGSWNVFIGDQSGMMTTGVQNTFVGNEAGKQTTSAFGNSFFGCRAGMNNSTGECNTFIGKSSGYSNNGNFNTFLGSDAGGNRPSGNCNTIIGANAGSSVLVDASNNTYLGYGTGFSNMGSGNVFIGYSAGSYYTNDTRSNRLYIANSDTETPLVYGYFPNNYLALNADSVKVRALVSGSGNPVYRNPVSGILVASSSDKRLKENIMPLENGLDKILRLQGVSYTWKADENHEKKIGLIAQDVEKILPELVFTNEADGYKGINYAEITAVLIEAVKELKKTNISEAEENNKKIDKQNEKISILTNENKELKNEILELKNLKAEIEVLKKHIKGYANK